MIVGKDDKPKKLIGDSKKDLLIQLKLVQLQQIDTHWLASLQGGWDVAKAYDQVIITMSAAGIGLCSTLLNSKDNPVLGDQRILLLISLFIFFSAVLFTVASFLCGKKSFKYEQKELKAEYNRLQGKESLDGSELRRKKIKLARITEFFNYISGISFVSALILLSISFIR